MLRIQTALVVLLFGQVFVGNVAASKAGDKWVREQFGGASRVLCNLEKGGEQFVVASMEGKVKLGYRLNMTSYDASHSFSTAWRLLGENGESSVARVPPVALWDKYVREEDGKIFAEGIQIQTLKSSQHQMLHAIIDIQKCQSVSCDSGPADGNRALAYSVDVCAVSLRD